MTAISMVVLNQSPIIRLELRTHLQLRKILASHLYAPQLTERRSTPFPLSTDGELSDGSIINYTPDDPGHPHHSCWTAPKSRPPPSDPYKHGSCSVCMVQRSGTDGSADYQLWARDQDNNAMGNMWATTVSPLNVQKPGNPINASMAMGGSPLLLQTEVFTPPFAQATLVWATPPLDPNNPDIWADPKAQAKTFDPASGGGDCIDAGNALNGAVRYAQCLFDCG